MPYFYSSKFQEVFNVISLFIRYIKSSIRKNHYFLDFFRRLKKRPFLLGFDFAVVVIYSYYLTFMIFGFSRKIRVYFSGPLFRVSVVRSPGSRVIYDNVRGLAIMFESFANGNASTSLILGANSTLRFQNTFHIGDGVRVLLAPNATLTFGGASEHQSSGITCDTKIISTQAITIGEGTIISWGCYISDSVHHAINGAVRVSEVKIGNHVWLSEGVTVGPGSVIGENSIVGSKSLTNKIYPSNTLIIGCPAVVKKTIVGWTR